MDRDDLNKIRDDKLASISNIKRQINDLKRQIDSEDIDIGGISHVVTASIVALDNLGIKITDAVQEAKDALEKEKRDKKQNAK